MALDIVVGKSKNVHLSNYITEERVHFLYAKTREKVIRCLSCGVHPEIYEAIMQREQVTSTGIGLGVAIPHVRVERMDLCEISIGIVQGDIGVDWNAVDGLPVRLIFLIIATKDHRLYLHLLSQVTQKIKQEEARNALLQACSKKQVVKIFQD